MTEKYTQSRARAFRECPRKHALSYVGGWKPTRVSEALRFGTLYHLGMEAWWKTDGTLADALAAVAGKGIDPFEQAKVDELLVAYDARWHEDRALYEVIGIEVPFECPLLNPETWRPSRTWTLAGKIDGIVRRKSDGAVCILEHKSSSESIDDPTDPFWAKLALDAQLSCYVVGAESLGHTVTDILYDVVGRPMQRPLLATPEEKRSYKKDGTLYANQRDKDETPEEYRGRVNAALAEAPHRYFRRQWVPRMESQVKEFLYDSWMHASMMRESARTGQAPKNVDACHRFGECPFWTCCSTGSKPEDFPEMYVRTATVNPELEV